MENYVVYGLTNTQDIVDNISKCIQNIECNQENLRQITFKNNERYVEFLDSVRNKTVILISRCDVTQSHDDLMELLIAADAAKINSASKIIAVIPFIPYGRQERRDSKRTSITSRLVADILAVSGIDHIITLDMHSTASQGFYPRTMPVENILPIELFNQHIKQNFGDNTYSLISPDTGFAKKLNDFNKVIGVSPENMIVMNKERKYVNEVDSITIVSGKVTNKIGIIMDDIVDTAGTLCKCADYLYENGVEDIYVYCTHGVLSANALENINNSSIKKVFVTNSILKDISGSSKIEYLDCSSELIKTIKRVLK